MLPEDLLKFGLIPEFVGRLPVITSVNNLDEAALIDILTKPKNAYVKQYYKFFEFDGVELEFTDEALRAIADRRSSGGRARVACGPSWKRSCSTSCTSCPARRLTKCLVDRDVVLTGVNPTLVPRDTKKPRGERQQRTA